MAKKKINYKELLDHLLEKSDKLTKNRRFLLKNTLLLSAIISSHMGNTRYMAARRLLRNMAMKSARLQV